MKRKDVVEKLLFFYLTIAPINWLPFTPLAIVNGLKYTFLILLLLFTFPPGSFSFRSANVFTPFYLFFILACSIPLFFQAYEPAFVHIVDIGLLFLMCWIIYNSFLTKEELFVVFYKVSIVIAIVCVLSIVSAATGITFSSPAPWNDPFSKGALGGYRTGWSNSIFLYIPFLLFTFFKSSSKKQKTVSVLAIVAIMGSQILSGGRAGLIASILAILAFSRFNAKLIIAFSIVAVIFSTFIPFETIEEHFRASDEQIENKAGAGRIDKISSGRVVGYQLGLDLFFESPIWGHGYGASDYLTDMKGYFPEIHNTLLKRLVDGGILLIVPILFLFLIFYKQCILNIERFSEARNHLRLFRILFFLGIYISMVEPNYLIGSFQGEAFFWALGFSYYSGKS